MQLGGPSPVEIYRDLYFYTPFSAQGAGVPSQLLSSFLFFSFYPTHLHGPLFGNGAACDDGLFLEPIRPVFELIFVLFFVPPRTRRLLAVAGNALELVSFSLSFSRMGHCTDFSGVFPVRPLPGRGL